MIAAVVSSLLLGLVGSTHCAAMCGGIVAASQIPRDGKRRLPSLRVRGSIILAQNVGRIVSYAGAGALAGGLGQVLGATTLAFGHTAAQLGAALMLLAVGASLAGVLPAAWSPERLGAPLWRRLAPKTRSLLPLSTPGAGFGFGLLWGFLPCGLVYSALALAALSGSVARGVFGMLAFGLGTLPMLLGLGAIAGTLASALRRLAFRRVAALAVATLGIFQLVLVNRALSNSHACCPQPDSARVAGEPMHH